ncbi:MAG: prephenate dehydrogenase [Actinobacteria bacterium]|nr:prephenate dehydrogenase [Actinomycetota bacterium]
MIPRTKGQVHIIGSGLLGTSIGLALKKLGVDVSLEDSSSATAKLAIDFGAGRALNESDSVEVVVVCVPPDAASTKVIEALQRFPQAAITDVASVKSGILNEVRQNAEESFRYVGSHPMAGREKGGALNGRPDLFVGRPWVIVPDEASETEVIKRIEALVLDLGATPVQMSAAEHDSAVALVSHTPQLLASLLAARLVDAKDTALGLAGAGLRDTTRIAASDPTLWLQIVSANSEQLIPILKEFELDLEKLIAALSTTSSAGSLSVIASALSEGNRGVSRIPGKHGGSSTEYSRLIVMIDDKPGELARLLTDIGDAGINLEDLSLDHATGALIGLVELAVLPDTQSRLVELLESKNWKLAG